MHQPPPSVLTGSTIPYQSSQQLPQHPYSSPSRYLAPHSHFQCLESPEKLEIMNEESTESSQPTEEDPLIIIEPNDVSLSAPLLSDYRDAFLLAVGSSVSAVEEKEIRGEIPKFFRNLKTEPSIQPFIPLNRGTL